MTYEDNKIFFTQETSFGTLPLEEQEKQLELERHEIAFEIDYNMAKYMLQLKLQGYFEMDECITELSKEDIWEIFMKYEPQMRKEMEELDGSR